MGDRDVTSHMKTQFMYLNNVKKQKEQKRIKIGHEKTLKSIEHDQILKEYGNYTQLLPDELKIYGKDKSYGLGPTVHKVDPTLIYKNTQAIQEGKMFQKKVEDYIYEQQMAMFTE